MAKDETVPTRAEQLTAQFYDWERRGRGWQLWDHPVEIEPPYRPFYFRGVDPQPSIDDAVTPTLGSVIADKFRGWFTGEPTTPTERHTRDEEDPEPDPYLDDSAIEEIQVTTPPNLAVTRGALEQFLVSLPPSASPLSFEVIGQCNEVTIQFASQLQNWKQQLRALYPEAVLLAKPYHLESLWRGGEDSGKAIVDFGLTHEFMLPLLTTRRLDHDPLAAIIGALSDLRSDEVGVLQVLFASTRHPWAESIGRAMRDGEGRAFLADAPETLTLSREKTDWPLFSAVVRAAGRSPGHGRAWEIVRGLGGALKQFSRPPSNQLMPLSNDGYDARDHETDLIFRRSHRSGMLLNSQELVSLVHLPGASVRAPALKRETRRSKAAPEAKTGPSLILGQNTHAGSTVEVGLSPSQRLRHTYVIGASGTGKSTLLLNMAIQDVEAGRGLAVIDPHGDLVDELLGHVPEERHKDVVLLDPGDREYSIGFNILSAHTELEKQLLASDLGAAFQRLSTSWGDQMTSVLGNAVLAFLESSKGGTLGDLRRFLVEPGFRRAFLETVSDSEVRYFWQKEFPLLSGKPQAPLLTRLDTFLRPKPIRHMVLQKENRLDFARIMSEQKILLVKLAQGVIGEENSYLLGTFLVSKLHQAAQSRQELPESERTAFYIYIDEFQHFLTKSMAAILSGARKFGLGLILAHQDLSQLGKRETGVLGAAISNPGTRVCFRVGDLDARKLEDGFSHFGAKDLQNLAVGEAICRIDQARHDFNLETRPKAAVDPETAARRRSRAVEFSRKQYGMLRAELEQELQAAAEPEKREQPKAKPERRPVETTAKSAPALSRETKTPAHPKRPGKGGQQHKYLQNLIKRWAESNGWHATIEMRVLDGLGSVDVALVKGERTVACEISVTTSAEHELGNVQKCLSADFDAVVVVAADRKALKKIDETVTASLPSAQLKRVRFFTPEELFAFLQQQDRPESTEDEVRGYKVKVQHVSVPNEEKQARLNAIAQVFRKAWRRMRGK